MFARLGEFIDRHWVFTILVWVVVVVALRVVSPAWRDVARDGDFAFLPPEMPSVVGEKLSRAAFPENRAKSQIVFIFARDGQPLTPSDLDVADRFASRFHNLLAMDRLADAQRQSTDGDAAQRDELLEEALAQLNEAVELDPENAAALSNRAMVRRMFGREREAAADGERAAELNPDIKDADELLPEYEFTPPLVDVWTRHNEVFGPKLRSKDRQAQLVILQLADEFMATDNIHVLEFVERELNAMRREAASQNPGLQVAISGSAAIGGDMLQSAAESIQNTEFFTITLVIIILLAVYRAPLLLVVPLATIGVSLSVSTSLLTILAQLAGTPGFEWWTFKIFTTSKIFIVVILFGAGTDFCLFLIGRFREQLEAGATHVEAIPQALAGVGDALVASALTTIAGLSMMFFADFGKFRSSGPAIGLCLFITLVACVTLAPAILRALGAAVFWPFSKQRTNRAERPSRTLWRRLANVVIARPGLILLGAVVLMAPLAWRGSFATEQTAYDLLSALDPSRESYRGSLLLKQHFPIGESGPIIVLARKPKAGFGSEDGRKAATAMGAIFDLTKELDALDGITSVRSLAEPRGNPPQRLSLASKAGLAKLARQQHRLTKSIFLAQAKRYEGDVTRFELVLEHDPFSREAIDTLTRVERFLQRQTEQADSFWSEASFLYAGTTASIRDLCDVTRSDRWRIQILVVLAVLLVLLMILRHPLMCVYLIASVLFSYLVTIGATDAVFAWYYGDSFQGLDWKVPIFLFVILVAVGEDYNIYLVTRVAQEQAKRGPVAGLREGVIQSGGIITSCGIIMAGTFVSMTTGSLRSIVELGFALSLGVLIDTFIVRTILVPSFLAMLLRYFPRSSPRPAPQDAAVAFSNK